MPLSGPVKIHPLDHYKIDTLEMPTGECICYMDLIHEGEKGLASECKISLKKSPKEFRCSTLTEIQSELGILIP